MIRIVNKQSMIKSLIYRVYAFVITFVVSWIITGNTGLSLTIGVVENIFKITTYYWFDEMWAKFTKKKYKNSVLFFTGLSGSGKTTISKEVLKKLQQEGYPAMLLDGDEIRDIFKNYGFDKTARLKHINDVAKMAAFLQKQGIIPIVSLISPYEEARTQARNISADFTEIYVSTPLAVCEKRDVKGLYAKARNGEIKDFTGVHETAPYEIPKEPDIIIKTENVSIDFCVKQVLKHIRK